MKLIVLLLVILFVNSTFASKFNSQQKAELVNLHNQKRATVSPPAETSLPPMKWDDKLEEIARQWASKCQGSSMLSHNAGRSNTYPGYVGENIYATTASSVNIAQAVKLWDDEKAFYNINTGKCQSGKVCGHYTQVVWAASTKIGCAYSQCSKLRFGTNLVCNYAPGGNFNGQKPYTPKKSGSSPSTPAPKPTPKCSLGTGYHSKKKVCERCGSRYYNNKTDSSACRRCKTGFVANKSRTRCVRSRGNTILEYNEEYEYEYEYY